jgi:hypothetical protein
MEYQLKKSQRVKFLNMKNIYIGNFSMHNLIYIGYKFMVAYFLIKNLILLWHIFWIHIFHFLYVTNTVSSFQKSTMSPFIS